MLAPSTQTSASAVLSVGLVDARSGPDCLGSGFAGARHRAELALRYGVAPQLASDDDAGTNRRPFSRRYKKRFAAPALWRLCTLVRRNHPALGQDQLNISDSQAEQVVESNRVANESGQEAGDNSAGPAAVSCRRPRVSVTMPLACRGRYGALKEIAQ